MKYLVVAFLGFALGVLSCSYEFHKQEEDNTPTKIEDIKQALDDKSQIEQKP